MATTAADLSALTPRASPAPAVVIGLSAINDFVARNRAERDIRVTPQVGIDVLLDQYDCLKRLVRPDHIGIG